MAEKRIVVPDGMLKAAITGLEKEFGIGTNVGVYDSFAPAVIIEAALRWLSEHPIEPTDAFLKEMLNQDFFGGENWTDRQVFAFCTEWQRRMLLSPEPEVPEAVKDLLLTVSDGICPDALDVVNPLIREAYRRGQKARP